MNSDGSRFSAAEMDAFEEGQKDAHALVAWRMKYGGTLEAAVYAEGILYAAMACLIMERRPSYLRRILFWCLSVADQHRETSLNKSQPTAGA